jgi:hypothetical protein
VGPRAGLDDAEKRKFLTLPGLELRPLGRAALSQSLYRLRYPGFSKRGVAVPSRFPVRNPSRAFHVLLCLYNYVLCSWVHLVLNASFELRRLYCYVFHTQARVFGINT